MGSGVLKTLLFPEVLQDHVLDFVIFPCHSRQPIRCLLLWRSYVSLWSANFLLLVVSVHHPTRAGSCLPWLIPHMLLTLATDVTLLSAGITGHFPEVRSTPLSHSHRASSQYKLPPWCLVCTQIVPTVPSQDIFGVGKSSSHSVCGRIHGVGVLETGYQISGRHPASSLLREAQ